MRRLALLGALVAPVSCELSSAYRLALLGALLAPVSCELSSAYLYDYAFHKSTQEALDYNLNVLWKMGEVMATGMATDLVYNASGPGDLHGRLRSGDGTLSLLVYSLLVGESLATYMHYAGFEDSTWVGVYNAGNGGGPAGNYTFAVAANVSRDADWWRVAVGACEPPDDAACATCCRSKWVTDARGAPAGDAFTTGYYDARARPWYVAGFGARGPVWWEQLKPPWQPPSPPALAKTLSTLAARPTARSSDAARPTFQDAVSGSRVLSMDARACVTDCSRVDARIVAGVFMHSCTGTPAESAAASRSRSHCSPAPGVDRKDGGPRPLPNQ